MSSNEDEFETIAAELRMAWSGIGLSSRITPLPGDDQCRRLVDLSPERAAEFAQYWHGLYVSAICDAQHLRDVSREEIDHSRESADYSSFVRDKLVRAGAAAPHASPCLHGIVI